METESTEKSKKPQVGIRATAHQNGMHYRYKNKRVTVYASKEMSDEDNTVIEFTRLAIIDDQKIREDFAKTNEHGIHSYVRFRPYSKYCIITTHLELLHPSLECLHHGIGERLKKLNK